MKSKITVFVGLALFVLVIASCGGSKKVSCDAFSSTQKTVKNDTAAK
jgi:hypothetical protein